MPGADDDYGGAFEDAVVLVTGGAGFIGSHLVRRLLALGAEVRVLDDLSTGRRGNLPDRGVSLVVGSILDAQSLRSAVAGCRFVFHQAAMVSVPLSVERPVECLSVNGTGTEMVLEAARDTGVRRVVFASSAAVYGGSPALPSRETDPIDCWSPYAASKACGEALMSAFGRCYDLSTVSLRYFNIFGPRQDPRSAYAAAIAAFLDAVRAGRPPTIFGDGGQTRDFTSVENVVHANLLAASSSRDLRGEILNIGTGHRTSLLDVVTHLGRIFGTEPRPTFAPERAGDVRHSVAEISRAREILGYDPQVDLARGLQSLGGATRAG